MAGYDEVMNGLRAQAQQVIGGNALTLADRRAQPQNRLATPAEKQWWNLAAKKAAGERIGREELDRSIELAPDHLPRNNQYDAMRHARWSNRMANEIDPLFANVAGLEHEGENLVASVARNALAKLGRLHLEPGDVLTSIPQTVSESVMDLKNNAQGLVAAREHRDIDPSKLTAPAITPRSYLQGGSTPAAYDAGGRRAPHRGQ